MKKSNNVPKDAAVYDPKPYEYIIGADTRYIRLLFEDGGISYEGYKIIELVEVDVIFKGEQSPCKRTKPRQKRANIY